MMALIVIMPMTFMKSTEFSNLSLLLCRLLDRRLFIRYSGLGDKINVLNRIRQVGVRIVPCASLEIFWPSILSITIAPS